MATQDATTVPDLESALEQWEIDRETASDRLIEIELGALFDTKWLPGAWCWGDDTAPRSALGERVRIAPMRWQTRLKRGVRKTLRRRHERAEAAPPAPQRPPGSAKASMFFDAYPRFYETSDTGAFRGRLNLRYEAIFAENRDIFPGARVLDIASHDGRWSLAALKNGAAEVVGIEAREELVAAARENLKLYCDHDGAYRFIAGDVFEVLSSQTIEADIVLCLGFLYHTLRYNELMRHIRDVNPRYLLIDTQVIPGEERPHVRLWSERVARQPNAVADRYSHGDHAVVGLPSVAAVEFLLNAYDFTVERFSNWGALIRDNPSVEPGGYAIGRRVTMRCVSTSPVTPAAEQATVRP